MLKTVHVLPSDGRWAVKREGKELRVFTTQREAIEKAKALVKGQASGQLVIHDRNGRVREHTAYGMPQIQAPPGKRSSKISKAVAKVTRSRLLENEPLPSRV
ncbi:MAG: DUF2188 domain-containing protein [Bryobacteraceae bacterium]|nr:DUF2188 domain-containing protein [Bryobacteraceae bacterium]